MPVGGVHYSANLSPDNDSTRLSARRVGNYAFGPWTAVDGSITDVSSLAGPALQRELDRLRATDVLLSQAPS